MSCEHWEQPIYLYRELNAEEQAAVDRHVATCAGCRALLDAVEQQYALTHQAAVERPEVPDPVRLTDAILASITPAPRSHVVLDSAWLRYSMAAASVLLVVAFLFEQPWAQDQHTERIATTPPRVEANSPVMDTRAFLEATQQKRAVPKRSLSALYAGCMQHNDCDNAAVRNFKTKMKL